MAYGQTKEEKIRENIIGEELMETGQTELAELFYYYNAEQLMGFANCFKRASKRIAKLEAEPKDTI